VLTYDKRRRKKLIEEICELCCDLDYLDVEKNKNEETQEFDEDLVQGI